jgi:cation:H+ antiporter
MIVWLQFAACAVLIGVAGARLSRYGDRIAEATGASRTWVGVILLASVTSLPELVTGLSAAAIASAPDLAIGDVLGSCAFNLLILAAVDLVDRREPVYTRAGVGHILSAGFGIILLGIAGLGVVGPALGSRLRVGTIGPATPVLVLVYLVAMRTVFRYERRQRSEYLEETAARADALSARQLAWRYALWACVVVGGGIWLPFIGARIADVMHWERSFVGTLLLAFATSLPEIVVTMTAARLGAVDLAIGNLLGSNLFNLFILALDDVAYTHGPILEAGSAVHLATVVTGTMMSGVAIVGLLYRPRGRIFRAAGWTSVALAALYLTNAYILYHHGR